MIAAPARVYAFYKQPGESFADGGFVKRRVVAFSQVGGNSPIYSALVMHREGYLIEASNLENFSHMEWPAE